MKGKSLIAENRELSFKVYCQSGGNVELTLRELEKRGLKLSKPTFYAWLEKYNFVERMRKIDSERQQAQDAEETFEESMMKALLDQKKAYEKYFLVITTPDHQAQYAYTGIIKAVLDIRSKMGSFKAALFLDFMKDLITYLSKNDSEAVPAIERNFDDFVQFAKEKYGS
jgi:hypothetical protein